MDAHTHTLTRCNSCLGQLYHKPLCIRVTNMSLFFFNPSVSYIGSGFLELLCFIVIGYGYGYSYTY